MQFFQQDNGAKGKRHNNELVGQEPDFSEEGWARRYPKKKKQTYHNEESTTLWPDGHHVSRHQG